MTPEQGIQQLMNKYRVAVLRVPLLAGNEAVNFTLDNFKMQGFLGATFQPWTTRKGGWKRDKRKGRALLIDTGRLRRSIRITRITADSVAIGSNVKYAQAHNQGASIGVIQSVKSFSRSNGSSVKAHTRRVNIKIPRRQFIGNSPYLNARISRVITATFLKELQ